MGSRIAARQPNPYQSGTNFKVWFDQFINFCETVKVGKEDPTTTATDFKLFLTFLDPKSFHVVQNLKIGADEQKDLKACFPKLSKALATEEHAIPARISIKYRTQKMVETLIEFAFQLELLGLQAFPDARDEPAKQRAMVDSFCLGVTDNSLSVKLLEGEFTTIDDALQAALKYLQAQDIKQYVAANSRTQNCGNDTEILTNKAIVSNTTRNDNISSITNDLQNTQIASDKNGDKHTYQNQFPPKNDRRYPYQGPFSQNIGPNKTRPEFPSKYNTAPPEDHVYPGYAYNQRRRQFSPRFSMQNQPIRPNKPVFRNNLPQRRNNFPEKLCYYCRKPNHVIRTCFARKRDMEQRGFTNF